MANNIKVQQLFIKKWAADLTNEYNFPLFTRVTRYVGPELTKAGFKVGDSFSVVTPTNATAEKGLVLNHIDDYVEETQQVKIQSVHQAFEFSIDELMFYLDPNGPNTLGFGAEQRIQAIAATINQDFINESVKSANYIPQSADDSINARWALAKNRLIALGCPASDDYFAMVSPDSIAKITKENRGVFNHSTEITKELKTGMAFNINGWYYSPENQLSVFTRSTGAADDLTVDGADQSGTTLKFAGLTGGNELKAGENFTIDGVYDVNINTKVSTLKLKHFVVTKDTTTGTLSFLPEIKTSGQFQNVSALPANGAKINILGKGQAAETQDFGFYRRAFLYVPLDASGYSKLYGAETAYQRDPKTGISMMVTLQGDIHNMKNIYRVDHFYAVALLKPEWSVKVPCSVGAF